MKICAIDELINCCKNCLNSFGFAKEYNLTKITICHSETRVFAVSYGLSLLLVLTLLREFFSGFSGYLTSTKTSTSKFQFYLNVERLKHDPLAPEIKRPLPTVLDVKYIKLTMECFTRPHLHYICAVSIIILCFNSHSNPAL